MLKRWLALAAFLALAACAGRTERDGGQGGGSATGGGSAVGGGSATGGGGEIDSGVDAGLPLSQYCAQLADHICGHEERCAYLDPAQESDCLARTVYECQGGVAAVNDGRYGYDPSSVAPCFAAVDATDCRFGRMVQSWFIEMPNECYAVLWAAAATTGHSCLLDDECVDGFCDDQSGSCPVCAPFLAVNEPCHEHGCDPRVAYCDIVTQACQPVFATGQGPCEDSPFSCALGSYCAYGVDGGPRLCQLRKADGVPCSNGDECLAYRCNANDYGADAGPSVCGFDAVGSPCGFNDDCTSGICDHSICLPPATQQGVGARCGNDTHCAPSLYCAGDTRFDSTCQPRLDAGEPCTYSSCAPGLTCSDWLRVCVALGLEGQPCGALDAGGSADSRDCSEMLWCDRGICVPELGLNDACIENLSVCAEGVCQANADGGSACSPPSSNQGVACADNSECDSRRCRQQDGGVLDAFHPVGTCAAFCQ